MRRLNTIMRKLNISFISCILMITMVGCSFISNKGINIPEDVILKLQTVINAEPVQFSDEEVTDEKVRDLIFINGEKMKDPLTLNDFGDGLNIREDEEDLLIIKGENSSAFLSYYGMRFAACIVYECNNIDEMYESPLKYISFYVDDDTNVNEVIYPISINGVTIGTTFVEAEKRLGFMQKRAGFDAEKGSGHYFYESDNMYISIYTWEKTIKDITIKFT